MNRKGCTNRWCGPCKTLDPVIEKYTKEAAGKLTLVKVNIDTCGDVAREMGVKAIPHVALMHKGKVVDCKLYIYEKSRLCWRIQ